jgi:DNA-binding LacI/PurR family transcriptional regulator
MHSRTKSTFDPSHAGPDDLLHRLTTFIAGEAPGARLPGVHVLAKQMRTSPVTLRLAVQQLVDAGMLQTRSRSGTYVASRQVAGPVALLSVHDLLHPRASRFLLYLMGELRQRLAAQGRETRLFIGERRPWEKTTTTPVEAEAQTPRDFLHSLRAGQFSAVVSLSALKIEPWLAMAQAMRIPIVGTNEHCPAYVDIASQEAVRFAVRRLLERGHRKLAFMGWKQTEGQPHPRTNLAAFVDEMHKRGGRVEPAWIASEFHPTRPYAGADALRELWTAKREKFDGLIITDDVLARTALPAIASMGPSVADRLAVVCHANQDDSLSSPYPMSWIRVERSPIADAIMTLLDESTMPDRRPRALRVPVAWVESSSHSDAPANLWIAHDGVTTVANEPFVPTVPTSTPVHTQGVRV